MGKDAMRKHLVTLLLAGVMGVLGFAVSGVAVAAGNEPPGQGECGHGNTSKPCKDDSQPDKGKDCEAHGNNGGVNEDHCKGEETTPTDTTTTDTTTTDSTPDETAPQETTSTDGGSNPNTPPSTGSSQPSSTPATESSPSQGAEPSSSDSSNQTPKIVGTPPVAKAANDDAETLGATANAPKPTQQAQQAPLTL
jgi:hypothetical protein